MTIYDDKQVKDILDDPVKWAYCFVRIRDKNTGNLVPWLARKYQAEVLRDKSAKKVLRWGRRCGKTETAIIKMLHKCFTRPNTVVVVATPFESQIRAIYQRIQEILNDSDFLKLEISSSTKNPYQITFKNMSRIVMFTSGTRSGTEGAQLRGQRADMIYLDEADYLQDEEIEAILAIALERPDIEILLTSTPTGKRAFFYRACTDPSLGYKEFYIPTTKIPTWNEKMEAEFRAMFSEVGYQHEVLAEFGEEVTGVFNKDKVDEATKVDYYYYMPLTYVQQKFIQENKIKAQDLTKFSVSNPAPLGYRCMGIDWDKNVA